MVSDGILEKVESHEEDMIEVLSKLITLNGLGPENGGEGEDERAQFLLNELRKYDFSVVERIDAPDDRVESGYRPNIVATIEGVESSKPALWFLTHMDVVPVDDEDEWDFDPFSPVIEDGKIYGRGSEDNGQSLVSTLFAVISIIESDFKPEQDIKLCFVSSEETGNDYGVKYLLEQNVFGENDQVIVPDSGNSTGDFIEVVEKSIIWIKFIIKGCQAHAGRPHRGLNAERIGSELSVKLDKNLHKKFPEEDPMFEPEYSTFEPTLREMNSKSVSTIPGTVNLTFDCRILPKYDIEEVLEYIEVLTEEIRSESSVKIEKQVIQKEQAPKGTEKNSKIVRNLVNSIKEVKGISPKIRGSGGNTCAFFLRKNGLDSVVWSTIDETMHKPNEYSKVRNMVNDSKVFAKLIEIYNE